jgi:NTP pyrophosphatase (non-canonical NTP hydrolase)
MTPLTPAAYQRAALRTTTDLDPARLALELASEAGEVAGEIAKAQRRCAPVDPAKLTHELGDVLWGVAVLAASLGLDLEDVMRANLAKLRERYPETP